MAASMGAVLHWDTLEQRKHKGQNLYYDLFRWKLLQLPPDVHRFCDPLLSAPRRKELLHLLRSLEEESSCQRLQILFSFSVPNPQVLDLMCALHCPLVSAGAGTGYWEFLLQSRGLDVVAFDQNQIFPPEMRYTEIMNLHVFLWIVWLTLGDTHCSMWVNCLAKRCLPIPGGSPRHVTSSLHWLRISAV